MKKSLAVWLILIVLFVLFFFPILFQGKQFAYRDDCYFYNPLFEYIQESWQSGEIPLWSPDDNLGMPLAATPTSAVFYPLKLIFFLPFDYQILYSWYIMLHIPLAFFGTFLLMRHWRFSRTAAVLSGIVYAFNGMVFFQYSNVIFLLGASWIPWGVWAGDLLLRSKSIRAFCALSLVLTMTVLGGEPQSGYFIGLILVALWFFYHRTGCLKTVSTDSKTINEKTNHSRLRALVKSPFWLLILSAFFAGGLSAIQLIPTLEFTRQSDRVTPKYPTSIWQVPDYLQRRSAHQEEKLPLPDSVARQIRTEDQKFVRSMQNAAGLSEQKAEEYMKMHHDAKNRNNKEFSTASGLLYGLGAGQVSHHGSHSDVIYNFSVHPINYVDLIWPNFGGRNFPINSYWRIGLLGMDWVPSFYSGILALILVLSVFRLRRKNKKSPSRSLQNKSLHSVLRYWGSWLMLIFFLAALGGYGPYWYFRWIKESLGLGEEVLIPQAFDPLGGVYWLMELLLPFFSNFRYPAKLLTPGLFIFAILAGIGWDLHRKNKSLVSIIQIVLLASAVAIGLHFYRGVDAFYTGNISNTQYSGKYVPDMAWKVVLQGEIQTLILTILFFVLIKTKFLCALTGKANLKTKRVLLSCVFLTLAATDLYLANGCLLSTTPVKAFRSPSQVSQAITEDQKKLKSELNEKIAETDSSNGYRMPPIRYYKKDWTPEIFFQQITTRRYEERVLFENNIMTPKYQYRHNRCCLNSAGTMMYKNFARANGALENLLWEEIFDCTPYFTFLDVPYLIAPPNTVEEGKDKNFPVEIVKTWEPNPTSLDPIRNENVPIFSGLFRYKKPGRRFWIYHDLDKITAPGKSILDAAFDKDRPEVNLPGESVNMIDYGRNKIIFDVTLRQKADLLVAEQFDPGWTARILPKNKPEFNAPVRKAFDLLRCITLPEGEYRVIMEYKPRSFWLGLKITTVCLALLLLFAVCPLRKKSDKKIENPSNQ